MLLNYSIITPTTCLIIDNKELNSKYGYYLDMDISRLTKNKTIKRFSYNNVEL